jgi:hypothetical protein
MLQNNSYNQYEEKPPEGAGENLTKSASAISATAGGFGAVKAMLVNSTPIGWFAKASPIGALTQTSIINNVAAGVAAIPDLIDAGKELSQGNFIGAGKKTVRAVVCGAIAFLPITAILNLASEVTTGNGIVDHMEHMANNISGAFTGGDKQKDAKVEGVISVPATAAMIGGGIAASNLAANHFETETGQKYSFGTIPGNMKINGKAIDKIASQEPQAIKGVAQVADVDYPKRYVSILPNETENLFIQEEEQVAYPRDGMPFDYWKNRMKQQGIGPEGRMLAAQQRSGGVGDGGLESGNSIFSLAADNALSFTGKEAKRDEQRELEVAQGAKMT